jgi:phospholipase C
VSSPRALRRVASVRRVAALLAASAAAAGAFVSKQISTAGGATTSIEHVVVIIQENHSFDNVLGALCVKERHNCAATTTGKTEQGTTVPLTRATDEVVNVEHSQQAQLHAIAEGRMDGFADIGGCTHLECYTQYEPTQIPALSKLAQKGAISDAYFSRDIVPSWGAHLSLFAQTLDSFVGNNPHQRIGATGRGWGCDSGLEAEWVDPVSHSVLLEPSCIPDKNGNGPFRKSPVQYVPTIADRMEEAGKSWGIYGNVKPSVGAYKWATCPSFAECLNGTQKTHMHEASQLTADASSGKLPNFAIVTPTKGTGQHNGESMIVGDNKIGEEVSAIQNGPDGKTTTIFIYYDDCGCFYDHVAPPKGLGIRLPLVIVSPFAKIGFTDHNVATNSSILAYAETVLHVKPVNQVDGSAYNFHESFSKTLVSSAPFAFQPAPAPAASQHLTAPVEDT